MALSTTEQLDYLWKKLGYGVTKTDTAANKLAYNEGIPSPLLLRADKIWAQAATIPSSKPSTTSSVVQVYKDGTGAWSPTVKCTEDLGASDNRTWKTNVTDWIPPEFGATYLVSVYIDNDNATAPQTTGTQIFAAGASASSNDEWFFDYQSGVLHFIGISLPTAIASGVTGKSIFISGARYIGSFGFSETANISNASITTANITTANITTANIGNLNITDNIIASNNTNANITLDPNGTGNVTLAANTVVTGSFTVQGNVILSGGSQSDKVTANVVTTPKIESSNANITVGSMTLIDSFLPATYRTAKYVIKASDNTGYESVEVLLVHNGTESYITVYGVISSTDDDIISISSNIGGGNVNLYASNVLGRTNTIVNFIGTYVKD
jgi:hypothetical protein